MGTWPRTLRWSFKVSGTKPRELAEIISESLSQNEIVLSVDIAGPGFINISLSEACWHSLLSCVLLNGINFGRSNIGYSKKVNVEFVSANPTGPLHVGHTRGAVFGDALASLLSYSGYEVTGNTILTMVALK